MPKTKTQLLNSLRRVFRMSELLNQDKGRSAQELVDIFYEKQAEQHSHNLSRRRFLSETAKAAVAVSFSGLLSECKSLSGGSSSRTAPKIAIIGAGIAGLTAAYYLKKSGYTATVYEASQRVGGRMYSAKDKLGNGLVSEIGGEFIDSSHEDLWRLANDLGLERLDTYEDWTSAKLLPTIYCYKNAIYSEAHAIVEFANISAKIQNHINALPDTINYTTEGVAKAFDRISIDEYFQKIGFNGWLSEIIKAAYIGEYGLETGEQSALNFLTLIGTQTPTAQIELFGESDERYKIRGGNEQIPALLAEKIKSQINYGQSLTAIRPRGKGYTLVFNEKKEQFADIVIMAIPFTVLRQIDTSMLAIPDLKRKSIEQLGYGSNTKLILGTNSRIWREKGYAGALYNESLHTAWDSSQGQNNNQGYGSYTMFWGGLHAENATKESWSQYMSPLNAAFGDFRSILNGKSEFFSWKKHPFSQGSYTCYRINQWTSIGSVEAMPVGNLLFAGEHCSPSSQGFMNGGAESGRIAAEYICKQLQGIV